ncbi:uncharacterized protein IL334_007361 [Kwoniella shivajii]|uniref:4'-phosphopantetheinyl transferase domain-containing protein n=1 Tax=Kwoniella shivajii TaxID=564305 RepID=A0ABZ1D990_9TREE|nr:hypothetical protein IL334_007361 [Kwoniella shivajii]
MIIGIGIDILSLTRFRNLLSRRDPLRLAKKICTEREYESFKALSITRSNDISEIEGGKNESQLVDQQIRFLSCRWTLKEAAYKSLSMQIHPLRWQDLDISHSISGAPILFPTNQSHRVKFTLLGSLSHDADVVVGVVIAQLNNSKSDSNDK